MGIDYNERLAKRIREECRADEPYAISVAEVSLAMTRTADGRWRAALTTAGGLSTSHVSEEWGEAHATIIVVAISKVRQHIPPDGYLSATPPFSTDTFVAERAASLKARGR